MGTEEKANECSKCTICESNMMHWEIDGKVCKFCSECINEGIPENEVKVLSLRKRDTSKYIDDAGALVQYILRESFEKNKIPKSEAKNLGKKEIAEKMYFRGICSAVSFFLGTTNPSMIRALRLQFCGVEEEDIKGLVDSYKKQGIDIDVEKLKSTDKEYYDLYTAEDIACFMNDAIFSGDWNKHREWIEKS